MEFKKLIHKNFIRYTGVPLGALGGYAYYHFIGCTSGTCPITSNPYISTLYGAVMGAVLVYGLKTEAAGDKGQHPPPSDEKKES